MKGTIESMEIIAESNDTKEHVIELISESNMDCLEINEIMKEQTKDVIMTIISIRDLFPSDIDELRLLHEEWFPIRYNQQFYDGASCGIWTETGGSLFARLAVQSTVANNWVTSVDQSPTSPFIVIPKVVNPGRPEWTSSRKIVGAVTASILPLTKVEDPQLLQGSDTYHTCVMYILTLGCRTNVRRRGVATLLLQQCLDAASLDSACGAVYLHVKCDNIRAIRFYEKNGFQNLRLLRDYYLINGQKYDAYLYIRYVNGAASQPGWLDVVTSRSSELEEIIGCIHPHRSKEITFGCRSSDFECIIIRKEKLFRIVGWP